ncbi:MAG: transcriptional regulator [Candidatus Marinimicrobia bacterium]|mgnify:CR=1 FL=1|nr:transcriptional regulator [Candidatus Neomarinimicrobiota bacterium]|tara:strand:- start:2453 stop:2797 length:345 start_codon:yes stop_codon:yes gene_type:complete
MVESNITKLYYSISEVSKITNLKQYVLRYWETEFPSLKPKKNSAGNRSYKQSDIDLIKKIKYLLYEKKYTIDGARVELTSKKNISISIKSNNEEYKRLLNKVLFELKHLLKKID